MIASTTKSLEAIGPPTGVDTQPVVSPKQPALHRTVIEAGGGWQLVDVRELWRFRELLYILIWRDVKVRYKQAVLGVAWAVIQPAMLMLVFSVFLGRLGGLSGGDIPYPLFVLSGIIPWTFFSGAIGTCANSVIGSERLITKIYFPRLAIPFASVGSTVFDFLISMGLLLVLMVVYSYSPSWQIIFAPLVFGILLVAATGVGTLLSALTVNFRDFRYLTPFMLQIGMYATPTIYMLIPQNPSEGLRVWLSLNPVVAPIASFRACMLGGDIPWGPLGISAAIAALLFAIGCLYFKKVEDSFADAI